MVNIYIYIYLLIALQCMHTLLRTYLPTTDEAASMPSLERYTHFSYICIYIYIFTPRRDTTYSPQEGTPWGSRQGNIIAL